MESMGMMIKDGFYKNKKVLVTGHTGFKGTWLTKILVEMGADVCGYSLPPTEDQFFFEKSKVKGNIYNVYGDIRDLAKLEAVFSEFKPEIVLHLAAQPLVLDSYKDPHYTYEVNVMGTVNICECVRKSNTVKSFVNVTTDKVYKNNEWEWGYRENEPLDGYDPYSNSKSCSELVTHSYINSFFNEQEIAVSTARAGNVIGGGDFSENRIVPDCVRSASAGKSIQVRNPNSVRPYQHVLEPLKVYLLIAQKQFEDRRYAGFYNVGPNEEDCIDTGKLAELFCKYWGDGCKWESVCKNGPHEANFLKLDCSKIKKVFGWKPTWGIHTAIEETVALYKCLINDSGISECMREQIHTFFSD